MTIIVCDIRKLCLQLQGNMVYSLTLLWTIFAQHQPMKGRKLKSHYYMT